MRTVARIPSPSNQGDARYAYHLRTTYGLSLDDYEALSEAQGYRCAICDGNWVGRLVVDHCHKTQRVQGLLCNACNRGLGMLKDVLE